MSSGPLSDLVNAQQGGPPQGLAPPGVGLMGGDVNGNVALNAPSNTGAGQFVGSGPLKPSDFTQGLVYNDYPSIGNPPPGGFPGPNPNAPQYRPDARPEMGGLLGNERYRRMVR